MTAVDHATKGKWYQHPIPQRNPPGPVDLPLPTETIPIDHEHTHHDPQSPEMIRIAKVYQWVVGETAKRLADLNTGIKDFDDGNKTSYNDARKAFNDFLDAINDQGQTTAFAGAIVGPTMMWAMVEPVMKDKYIYGAKIYVKWLGGTHSSSSGVAISHP